MSVEKKSTSQISLRIKPETVEAIDAYRRVQDLIPNRTDAIEALIEFGFLAWKKSRDEKKEKANGR
jgi:hypothetical protein